GAGAFLAGGCVAGTAVAVVVAGAAVDTLKPVSADCGTSASFAPLAAKATAGFSPEQTANAAAIVHTGQTLGVPPRGWVVAVATAMQESDLHNLPGGDHDSVGLFQQRPSQGWGAVSQIMNPEYSATQ